MSDIPQFPLAAYKLQFKPVDTTNCIHVESFASMDYTLQLDYAKLYHVPHAETLSREVLINIFCKGNQWVIALEHPEHIWRPSRSGGITIVRNHKSAAAARLLEEERAVEEELTEDEPIAERFPSPDDDYDGPAPPPEAPPPSWEPPVPVRLELTYPPKPRNLGVNESGEPITEPLPEDFLAEMMQESYHSFESAKNKVREAINDSNAALADVLKFQAKLKAQRMQYRDLMEAVYSIVGPAVAKKIEEAVKLATRDGVVEQWEDPDVFGQEDESSEEDNQPSEEEKTSQPEPAEPIQPQEFVATQPAAPPTQPRPRTFLVPELPMRLRNAVANNKDQTEGASQPSQTSRPRSHSNGTSTSSKRSREEDDEEVVETRPSLSTLISESFRNVVAQVKTSRKRARRGESPFNNTTTDTTTTTTTTTAPTTTSPTDAAAADTNTNNNNNDGKASDSSSSSSAAIVNGVPWHKYVVDDEADEMDSTYSPSSSDGENEDRGLSWRMYERDPLSPSGLSDSDSDNEAPSGSSQSSSNYFGSQGNRPTVRHPTGPRPPAPPPPPEHERSAKRLKRNDNCLQVNPETGKLEIIYASDDPERGQRFRDIPIQAERIEDILHDITTYNTRIEFDEEAWKAFELPEESR